MPYKFDDCPTCIYRKRPDVCEDCNWGEEYEEDIEELPDDEDWEMNKYYRETA